MRIHLIAALLLSAFCPRPGADPATPDRPFRITPFAVPFPQATLTQVMGLNDLGAIVGVYQDPSGNHAFLRRNGNYTNIDITLPGVNETAPNAINLRGDIAGRYQFAGRYHGFIRANNRITTVDYPDVNNFGTVLTGINLEGQTIGIYSNLTATEAFLYSRNRFTLISYPGASVTYVSAINDLGTIVGFYSSSTELGHPFLYQNGRFTPFVLPAPNVYAAYPLAINDRGQIAGHFSDPAGEHGFILDSDQNLTIVDVPHSLYSYFLTPITLIRGINNFDQIVGTFDYPGTSFTAVPERPWF